MTTEPGNTDEAQPKEDANGETLINIEIPFNPVHTMYAIRGVSSALDSLTGGQNIDMDNIVSELTVAARILSTMMLNYQLNQDEASFAAASFQHEG